MITTGSDEDDGDGTLWGRKSRRQSTRRKTSDDAHGAAPLGAAPRIIAAIRKNPRTVGEIMVDLRLTHQTASSVVNKLMREGVLVDSKKRRRNPESGREAIVWEWEEVVDPAGGDQDVFDACATTISDLVDALLPRLRNVTCER